MQKEHEIELDELKLRIWIYGALFPKTHLRDAYNNWLALQTKPEGWYVYSDKNKQKYGSIGDPSNWGGFLNARRRREVTQWDPMLLLLPYFLKGRYSEDDYWSESFVRPTTPIVGQEDKDLALHFLKWMDGSLYDEFAKVDPHRKQQGWYTDVRFSTSNLRVCGILGMGGADVKYSVKGQEVEGFYRLSDRSHALKVKTTPRMLEWQYTLLPDNVYTKRYSGLPFGEIMKVLRKSCGLEGYVHNLRGNWDRNITAIQELQRTVEDHKAKDISSVLGNTFRVCL